jgi:hypothetical protein
VRQLQRGRNVADAVALVLQSPDLRAIKEEPLSAQFHALGARPDSKD